MKRLAGILAMCSLTMLAHANGTVTFNLSSPSNGTTVSPGTPIEWTITVSASTADNLGLALAAVDLVQDAANPAACDLPGGGLGLDYDVRAGVGQGTPQIPATGLFLAPSAPGLYGFHLGNPRERSAAPGQREPATVAVRTVTRIGDEKKSPVVNLPLDSSRSRR